jgi:hypothetical protein
MDDIELPVVVSVTMATLNRESTLRNIEAKGYREDGYETEKEI